MVIAPGTIITFNGNYFLKAIGTLKAKGIDSLKIIFTSNLKQRAGDWNQITLNNSASIIENCIIEYCTIGFNFLDVVQQFRIMKLEILVQAESTAVADLH